MMLEYVPTKSIDKFYRTIQLERYKMLGVLWWVGSSGQQNNSLFELILQRDASNTSRKAQVLWPQRFSPRFPHTLLEYWKLIIPNSLISDIVRWSNEGKTDENDLITTSNSQKCIAAIYTFTFTGHTNIKDGVFSLNCKKWRKEWSIVKFSKSSHCRPQLLSRSL